MQNSDNRRGILLMLLYFAYFAVIIQLQMAGMPPVTDLGKAALHSIFVQQLT